MKLYMMHMIVVQYNFWGEKDIKKILISTDNTTKKTLQHHTIFDKQIKTIAIRKIIYTLNVDRKR